MSEMSHEDMEMEGDFFEHEPSKVEKQAMRKASKPPSEWLKLLCTDWAEENADLVEATDAKFLEYKSFLKGMLSSQLLCRLSIPPAKESAAALEPAVDFWGILGIEDEFDKAYIVAQVERFASLYSIRGWDEVDGMFSDNLDPATLAAASAAGLTVSPSGLPSYMGMDSSAAAAAATAAAAAAADVSSSGGKSLSKKQAAEVSKAHRLAKDAERALDNERRSSMKKEQRRMTEERKNLKAREREQLAIKKAAERAARDATREERRRKKQELREQREKFSQEQKSMALKRAAELVASNRVPIELTRGAAAAAKVVEATGGASEPTEPPTKKRRSAIVVSTAGDLHQIVTHANNLWKKYNAIAKEHNQKVNWITVAREIGIHVKVREKYSRMHARADQRGFDWDKNADWKIKDHPEIFHEPTAQEQKSRLPPSPDPQSSVTIGDRDEHDAVAAAAAVVDHTVVPTSDEQTAAAVAAHATMVADPTAGLVDGSQVSL